MPKILDCVSFAQWRTLFVIYEMISSPSVWSIFVSILVCYNIWVRWQQSSCRSSTVWEAPSMGTQLEQDLYSTYNTLMGSIYDRSRKKKTNSGPGHPERQRANRPSLLHTTKKTKKQKPKNKKTKRRNAPQKIIHHHLFSIDPINIVPVAHRHYISFPFDKP